MSKKYKEMNEATFVFNQEVREKRSLARAARGRVNGSRSKKCTLPSDYLTPAQKRKLNGEIIVYNLGQPMTWSEFKAMKPEYQESYLNRLMNRYGVSFKQLGEMFGLTNTSINQFVKRHNLRVEIVSHPKRMTDEQKAHWDKFLAGEENKKVEDMIDEITDLTPVEKKETSETPIEKSVTTPMQVSDISVKFDGEINFNEIVAYLQLVLGDRPQGHLTISFSKD